MGKDKDIFATSLAVKKISFCMMLFNIAGWLCLYWFCNHILTVM